jgi:GxxExxY protein
MQDRTFDVETNQRIPLVYRGRTLINHYFLDLRVDGKVVIELKSVSALAPVHTAQLLTYLKLTGCPVGLLLNFNVPVMKQGIKRVIRPGLETSGGLVG